MNPDNQNSRPLDAQAPTSPTPVVSPQPVAPWSHVIPQDGQPVRPAQPVLPQQSDRSKSIAAIALSVGLFAAAAFGSVTAYNSAQGAAEAKVGADFIQAVQDKDYSTVKTLVDPSVAKLGDKIGELGDQPAENGFYKSYVQASNQSSTLGEGDIKKVKVIKDSAGDNKYAYVLYKVGAKEQTVVEVYDNGEPKVLAVQDGAKTYTPALFSSQYKDYKSQISSMGRLVDQIAMGAGDSSKQTIQQIFPDKN